MQLDSLLEQSKLPEGDRSKIQRALTFLGGYYRHLSSLLSSVPDSARERLATNPHPSLAIGQLEVWACGDGFIVLFRNGFDAELRVTLHYSLGQSIGQVYGTIHSYMSTFINPISKFQLSGHHVNLGERFLCPPGMLMKMIFENHPKSDVMIPLCSKVFLFGADYFDLAGSDEDARNAALQDFQAASFSLNLRSETRARDLLEEFRSLLQSELHKEVRDEHENALQLYLRDHPEILCPNFEEHRSKPSLGGERQPDFAFSVRDYGGVLRTLVEIESSRKKIFTTGDTFQFTHEFTQAKGQILEWDRLLSKDAAFFERRFGGLYKPRFLLVYGRDHELDHARRDMLRSEFAQTSNREFCTYDDLARRFERIVDNFGKFYSER